MAVRNPSRLVSFDAGAVLDAAREAAQGPVYSFVEFDADEFVVLYVAEATLSFYPDRERMTDHFELIHSHARLDFAEIDLMTDDLFPVADRVEYILTGMDYLVLLRVYAGREGVFVALDPDDPVDPVLAAVEGVLDRDG